VAKFLNGHQFGKLNATLDFSHRNFSSGNLKLFFY